MTAALAPHPCPHCATPVLGAEGTFCCHGCEQAAALLAEAGLLDWYDRREQPAPRASVIDRYAWASVPLTNDPDGTTCATVQIDGLRCASCVTVTEQLLARTPGVTQASVSFATGRAVLRFHPDQVDLAALTGRIAALGYTPRPTGEARDDDRDLLLRLGVAAFGAANVMGLSAAVYVGWLDGMDVRFAHLMRWMTLLVATPVILWSAAPFFRGAVAGLRHRVLSMDLPVAVAIAGMYAHAVWATLHHEDGWLDSATMLVTLLLAGRALEARGRRRTAEAASTLARLTPRNARRVTDDGVQLVPTDTLRPGDLVDLGSGEEIPADGRVVSGHASVRLSVLTGESAPTEVAAGGALVAGAVIEDGSLRLEVTHTGADTLVGRMAAALETAGAAPRLPGAADHLAPAFTFGTLIAAGAVAAVLLSLGQPEEALARAVAVLVVACPCAVALAGPLVGAAGLGAAARRGLLLRGLDAQRKLATVDVVVLDKTGTITEDRPVITEASDDALQIAAALERWSRHPIAAAVLDAATARGLPIPVGEDVREVAGQGISGRVHGERWRLCAGAPGTLRLESDGIVHLLRLHDTARPEVARHLAALRGLGCRLVLLTGDRAEPAAAVAAIAGVDEVIAGATPEAKADHVRRLQADGARVLFVGDGINDGLALSAADVGLAMGSGAASSLLVADGVVVGGQLGSLAAGLTIARDVEQRTRRSLARSVAYNVAAVLAAVAGLINPLIAAILMPLSSALVITSAARVEAAARS